MWGMRSELDLGPKPKCSENHAWGNGPNLSQWVVKGNLPGQSSEHAANPETLFRDHKHRWPLDKQKKDHGRSIPPFLFF